MKKVSYSELIPGTVTHTEYYSEKGKLLLAKGVIITKNHLASLKRHNYKDLYIKPPGDENDELIKLLTTKMADLEELDFDTNDTTSERKPRELSEIPGLKDIKIGKAGFIALQESKLAERLDKRLKSERTSDRPKGHSLISEIHKTGPEHRTEKYKKKVLETFEAALKNVKRLLNLLARGKCVNGEHVRYIVMGFVEQFITDRDILLNLATIRKEYSIYFYNHSLCVCLIAINIAAELGYSKEQITEIGMCALLNDVGMLLVPREIYLKKGKLTKSEKYEIYKHPILSLHMLEKSENIPECVKIVAYQSHEQEDAKGYPKGRNKKLIHRYAKIIRIADMFVAISSDRAYREKYMPYIAMEMVVRMAWEGVLCKEFVKAFLKCSSLFPVGSYVEISDKRIAKVIQSNDEEYPRPVISVLTNEQGKILPKDDIYQIDLSKDTDNQVVKPLESEYLEEVSVMDGF